MSISTADHSNENISNQTQIKNHKTHKLKIQKIDSNATSRWLSKGIEDFKIANINSLLYGVLFVIFGAITVWLVRSSPYLVITIIAGFYLVGPPIAAGLYDMSQRIERGESPSFLHAISVLGRNTSSLIGLTLILGALMVSWIGAATLIVNVFFGEASGINMLLGGELPIAFSGALLIGGIILALVASAASFTFLPLLNNRQMGTITVLVILALIMLAWVRVMVLAINTFLDNASIIESSWNAVIANPDFLYFALVFLLVGLIFAGIAFTLSVVAVPLIIDRHVNVMTAISTSIKAVRKNPVPMFRWAATIAVSITVGFGLFFIGLIFVLPIIGHASWHAYRELVVDE